jgi:hypothetical protein
MRVSKPPKGTTPNELHKDLLDREFQVGQYVAVFDGTLCVARITRFTPKMVEVEKLSTKWRHKKLKYANEMVILDGPDVFMWVLTNGL